MKKSLLALAAVVSMSVNAGILPTMNGVQLKGLKVEVGMRVDTLYLKNNTGAPISLQKIVLIGDDGTKCKTSMKATVLKQGSELYIDNNDDNCSFASGRSIMLVTPKGVIKI